jgi:hypothetical protein
MDFLHVSTNQKSHRVNIYSISTFKLNIVSFHFSVQKFTNKNILNIFLLIWSSHFLIRTKLSQLFKTSSTIIILLSSKNHSILFPSHFSFLSFLTKNQLVFFHLFCHSSIIHEMSGIHQASIHPI